MIPPPPRSTLFPYTTLFRSALNERQRKMLNKLVDGFEGKLTSSKWARMAKCSPDTALRDIQDMIEKAILRSEEHTSELQSQSNLVCRLLLEKKNRNSTVDSQ